MGEIALIAIGGNSLIKNQKHKTVQDQYNAICETAAHVADIVEQGFTVILTHGNGPQVGFILRRSELAHEIREIPVFSHSSSYRRMNEPSYRVVDVSVIQQSALAFLFKQDDKRQL